MKRVSQLLLLLAPVILCGCRLTWDGTAKIHPSGACDSRIVMTGEGALAIPLSDVSNIERARREGWTVQHTREGDRVRLEMTRHDWSVARMAPGWELLAKDPAAAEAERTKPQLVRRENPTHTEWSFYWKPERLQEIKIDVPSCPLCGGKGQLACILCGKTGVVGCLKCLGGGRVLRPGTLEWMDCPDCHGRKKVPCPVCHGPGLVTCSACKGTGKLADFTHGLEAGANDALRKSFHGTLTIEFPASSSAPTPTGRRRTPPPGI